MVLAQSFREQFEFDSVDYLNFVLALEKRLEIRIPKIEYPRLASLDGCIGYLAAKLGAWPAHGGVIPLGSFTNSVLPTFPAGAAASSTIQVR